MISIANNRREKQNAPQKRCLDEKMSSRDLCIDLEFAKINKYSNNEK